jgi:aminoglycoside phosphotransferase (APT) family kinase protein
MQRREGADLAAVAAVAVQALGVEPDVVERTEHGVAGQVYRVARGADEWFARLGDTEEDDLSADAMVHARLSAVGVRVPEVVHVEARSLVLGRSVLVTRHVGGVPLSATADHEHAADVAHAAGADLAAINRLPVDGFGWVRRDMRADGGPTVWPLRADYRDYPSCVVDDLPAPWPGAFADLFDVDELDRLADIVSTEQARPLDTAALAHGDFCLDHIFHVDGRYTGIIDFGEIRGTEPFFDLGVFVQSGVHQHPSLRAAVMSGYFDVTPRPVDADALIRTAGLLKALRHLGAWLQPTFTLDRPKDRLARTIATRLLPAAERARASAVIES